MGQISFNDLETMNLAANTNIGYLTLADDGNSAIVRVMENSVEDLEKQMMTIHSIDSVSKNGKRYALKVNCLRNPRDPMDKCPFCEAQVKLEQKLYMRLIQYTMENGKVVATPKIFERGAMYAKQLMGKIQLYGPLSEHVSAITRYGRKGDTNTTYSLEVLPDSQYPESAFPKHPEFYENYSVIGDKVLDKTAEEMIYYIQNGAFPINQGAQANYDMNNTSMPAYSIPTMQPGQTAADPVVTVPSPTWPTAPAQTPEVAPAYQTAPATATPAFSDAPAAPTFARSNVAPAVPEMPRFGEAPQVQRPMRNDNNIRRY